jgi:tripartite-type tricarboxylate transporter receptor subunit TctC
MMAGIRMLHVPYSGVAPAQTDLLSGRIQVMFDNMATAIEQIRTGRVRALGVTTANRSAILPEVPTIAESLPGFEASSWYGVTAPKSTPPEVVDVLNREINAVLADPAIVSRFFGLGGDALPGSPADFGRLIAEDTEKWGRVVRFAGAKAN